MLSHSKRSVFYFKKRMILFTLPHHSTPHTPDNAWLPVPESVANTLEGYAHLEQSLTDRQINTCDDFPKPPLPAIAALGHLPCEGRLLRASPE